MGSQLVMIQNDVYGWVCCFDPPGVSRRAPYLAFQISDLPSLWRRSGRLWRTSSQS